MSPSQIVKSAYMLARAGGYTKTMKMFAREVASAAYIVNIPHETLRACKEWLANKAKQRKQANDCARKARRGHDVVHTQLHARSVANCTGRGTPVFVREGVRP